jgi:hypothetical protein
MGENIEEIIAENKRLKKILFKCLKARQVNHVRQIIKEEMKPTSKTN